MTSQIRSLRYGLIVVVLTLVVTPVTAFAQHGMGGPGGMGGMGGGGRGRSGGGQRHGRSGGRPSDSAAVNAQRDSLIEHIGFAGFVLMHKSDLSLTDSQTVALTNVDSVFHATVDTMQPQLETLRAENAELVQRVTHASAGDTLSTATRDSVVQRRKTMGQLTMALRAADQDTRTKAMAILSPAQQTQIATLGLGGPRRRDMPPGDEPPSGGPPGGPPGMP